MKRVDLKSNLSSHKAYLDELKSATGTMHIGVVSVSRSLHERLRGPRWQYVQFLFRPNTQKVLTLPFLDVHLASLTWWPIKNSGRTIFQDEIPSRDLEDTFARGVDAVDLTALPIPLNFNRPFVWDHFREDQCFE